jgi:hypothetical protein
MLAELDDPALGLALAEGETDRDADALIEGETDGDIDAPVTLISAQILTPLVALLTENDCTQKTYVPVVSAGHLNVASSLASGASLIGDKVCSPPGSVT